MVCCEEEDKVAAFQAKIYGIDSDELKEQLQKWVESQVEIIGWNTTLKVSSTWEFNLPDDELLDSDATCFASNSSNSSSNMWMIIALVFIVAFLLVVIGVIVKRACIWACFRRGDGYGAMEEKG